MNSRPEHRDPGAAWSAVESKTLVDLVTQACRSDPDRPAMIFEDGLIVSRRDLLSRAERFAGYLADRVSPGDRVAIMLGNRAEFMVAWLATVANRAAFVPINPAARDHDAKHVLQDSGAKIVVVDSSSEGLIRRVLPDCPAAEATIMVESSEPDGLQQYGSDTTRLSFPETGSEREDVTGIYYTSGSTGPPKGCMIDHEWWLRAVDIELRLDRMSADDRLLCCLQFFYSDPAWMLLMSLHSSGTLVVMRRFSVSRFWNVVRTYGVTKIISAGSIPVLLLKAPPDPDDRLHSVRLGVQIGLAPNVHRQMVDRWGFPWVDNYGITEGGIVSRVPLHLAEEMIGSGSMGIPAPEVTVRIVDEHDGDVGLGASGEILVKAPGMMCGYLNRPGDTEEAMRGGWLHTGDLGRVDERGFLFFAGRKKDIIRRSGENVAASEVEQVLRAHPKILEAAVLPVPDDVRDEEIKAYIVPVPGDPNERVTPEEIIAFCEARLASYKVPRYVEFREDLPRTPTMRIQKDALRKEQQDLTDGVWDREKENR